VAQITPGKHPIVFCRGTKIMHLSSLCSLCTYNVIVVINLCFSFSSGINGLVLWCFFPVFSNPSWSRWMATLPESGSARGFFLLKGSFSFHSHLMHTQDKRLESVGFLNWGLFLLALYVWIGLIWNLMIGFYCITSNWILIGLNWIVSLKSLEMTFVVI